MTILPTSTVFNRLSRAAIMVLIVAAVALPGRTGRAATPEPGASLLGNYLAGRHAQAARDLKTAAIYLRAALAQDKTSPELLRRTFLVLLVDGRVKDAIPLARRLLKVSPDDAIAHLTLAVADFARKDYADVPQQTDRIDGAGFGQLFRPLFTAWAAAGQGKTDVALAALSPLDKQTSSRALHDTHAALIDAIAGRFDPAIDRMTKVMEYQGGFALRTTELLGAIYEAAGDKRKAEAMYQSFIDQYPDTRFLQRQLKRVKAGKSNPLPVADAADGIAEALYGVASSFNQQNAPETALILARLARYLRPDFAGLTFLTGNLLEQLYGPEHASALYREIDPKDDYAWAAGLRRATNLADMGEIDDAAKLLETLARRDKTSPDPLIDLGNLMRSEGRFEEAVKVYDRAFKRIDKPGKRYWTLYYARGIALERSNQWKKAEADLLRALSFEPDQPLILNYLGYSWIEFGENMDKALKMIRHAVELRPNDGYIVDSLGWAYFKLGRWQDAVTELERAVEYKPEDPIINDHLGDAYWRAGRHREARFQWQRSLGLDPEKDAIPTLERKLRDGLKPRDRSGHDSDSNNGA